VRIEIERTTIPEVVIVKPSLFEDERGFFSELFRADVWSTDEGRAAGLPTGFAQVNQSRSRRGVIRGLHFQWDPPQGKLMRVVRGEAFAVAVDIRPGSPTLGRWVGTTLNADAPRFVWAPASFARGFGALSDLADVEYFVTAVYNGAAESGIRWDDPAIGIQWPITNPQLSAKDAAAPTLAEWLTRPEAAFFDFDD
jgi:dTDP-4-dehydrorhamnose 3,5-epimerase